MRQKRQAAVKYFEGVRQVFLAITKDESAVAAIEYALLASLIAVVAVGSIAALGGEVEGMWLGISDAVLDALKQ